MNSTAGWGPPSSDLMRSRTDSADSDAAADGAAGGGAAGAACGATKLAVGAEPPGVPRVGESGKAVTALNQKRHPKRKWELVVGGGCTLTGGSGHGCNQICHCTYPCRQEGWQVRSGCSATSRGERCTERQGHKDEHSKVGHVRESGSNRAAAEWVASNVG